MFVHGGLHTFVCGMLLVVKMSQLHVLVCLVAVWSAVNVAGTRLQDLAPNLGKIDDPENWEQVHCDVIERCVRDGTILQLLQ